MRPSPCNIETIELRRYAYALDGDSVVVDAGGYDGRWAENIARLYDPTIIVFEPVPRFYEICQRRFTSNPKVLVCRAALSDVDEVKPFCISSNDSGFYTAGTLVKMDCMDAAALLEKDIDLLKLNVEGEEYRILMRLIVTGTIRQARDIQVQFHRIGTWTDAYYPLLRALLEKTHHLTLDYPYIWENWRRNDSQA